MIRNFKTVFGEKVTLPDDKWKHIVEKHPEVKRYSGKIREVLQSPDIVKISKRDIGVHLYYKYYGEIFEGKYLLVVMSSKRKSIITMFITDKIKVGEVLWQKR